MKNIIDILSVISEPNIRVGRRKDMLVPLCIHSLNVYTQGIFCMNIALRVVHAERQDTASVLSVIARRVAASRIEHENILGKTRGQSCDSLTEHCNP